jgi:O-antigen ligase
MVGRELATPHAPDVVALVVALATLFLCLAAEWLAIALLATGVAGFAYAGALPEFRGVHVTELLLALLVTVAAVRRWPAPPGQEARRVSAAMGLFVAMQAVGIAVGLERGASVTDIAHGFRPVVYWAAYWPIAAFVSRPEARTHLFRIAGALAFVAVALQVLQVSGLFGSHNLFLTEAGDNTITIQGGFLRVRPPGLTLVYVVGIFAIAYLLWGPPRRRALPICLAVTSLLGVALSLNRNMVIGLVLGFAVGFLILPGRSRLLAVSLVMACIVVLSYSALASSPTGGGTAGTIAARFASIGNYSGLKSNTLDDRYYENRNAIGALARNPLLGIGWGTPYGAELTTFQDGHLVSVPRSFIHQQYLGIWLRMGLPGLVAFLAVLWIAFRRATSVARRDHTDERWIAAGAVVSLVALASGAWVATYFFETGSILPSVGLIAIAMTCGAARARDAHSPPRAAKVAS